MINLPEGHFPVTHPALKSKYDKLRADWLSRLFWLVHGVRGQVRSGPAYSSLGANLAQDAAAIAHLEGEINALTDANIRLREESQE